MFIFLIFPTMLRWTTKKHFLSLFWILRNVFLPWVLSLIINNWTLSWDCISPDLKQGTKHSDETFINSLSKIKHKNENLCHKKSQTSYKNWQIIEKSPKLVKKEAKSHKLAKEKSLEKKVTKWKISEKSHKHVKKVTKSHKLVIKRDKLVKKSHNFKKNGKKSQT